MKARRWIAACVAALVAAGCVTVRLGGRGAHDKLRETTVQGRGWNKILILDLTGFLADVDVRRPYAPPVTLLRDVEEKLRKARKDRRVKALVLRINSPGGTVTAADTIYREIRRFKEEKRIPVAAQIMDVGASGAYYAALAADRIVAQPTSITGSIGVMVQKFNVERLLAKVGVENTPVKSGPHKDIGSPFRPATPEERRILQETVDALHDRFVERVAAERPSLTPERVRELADGRIFPAEQARSLGLIDEVGYLDQTLEEVRRTAGLRKARVVLYHLPSAYADNIYSAARFGPVTEIHLLDLRALSPHLGSPFLYLWEGALP